MALDPRIKRLPINRKLTEIQVKDVTGSYGDEIYTTDDGVTYALTTNTWGYGAPNPLKAELAKIFILEYKGTKKNSFHGPSVEYLPAADEFLTVTFPYLSDGWHRFHYVGLPLYDALEAETEGMVRFFPDSEVKPYNGEIKALLVGSWATLTPEELITEHMEAVEITKYMDSFFPYKTDRKQASLHRETVMEAMGRPDGKCDNDDLEQMVLYLSEIATSAFCAGHKPEAQRMIEGATEAIKY